jgi:hypothetical protein
VVQTWHSLFWRPKLGTNSHFLILWVDVVHKGVDRLREVDGGANVDIRPCGKHSDHGERLCEIVITSHWLHDLCDECMLAVLGVLLLIQGQVRLADGLDHGTTCHSTAFCGASVPTKAAAAAFFFHNEGDDSAGPFI